MAITNYTELQAAVANWIKRSDLTLLIPEFVGNAEAEFNRTLRLTGQMVRDDLAVSSRWTDLSAMTAPVAEIKSVSITTSSRRHALSFLPIEQTQAVYETGEPCFFTRTGDELGVIPPPDGAYTLELIYWRKIPDLATNSTNFLLTLAPDLYLYRSALEGALYLFDDELAARCERMYARALEQVRRDDTRRRFGASSLEMRAA